MNENVTVAPTGDALLYNFELETSLFIKHNEAIMSDTYPNLDFFSYQPYMVETCCAYYGLAIDVDFIKGNKNAFNAYDTSRAAFLKANTTSLAKMADVWADTLTALMDRYAQGKNPMYILLAGNDIAGAGLCYFNGLNALVDALMVDGFPEAIPKGSYMNIDDINRITFQLYNMVMGWKDNYEALDDDAKRILKEIYAERNVGGVFPWDPGQDDTALSWNENKTV